MRRIKSNFVELRERIFLKDFKTQFSKVQGVYRTEVGERGKNQFLSSLAKYQSIRPWRR